MIITQKIFLKRDGDEVTTADSEQNADAIIICPENKNNAIKKILLSFLNKPGRIIIDFEDILAELRNRSILTAGYGEYSGENHPITAARDALSSLIKAGGKADKHSDFIILHFACSKDTTMSALTNAVEFLSKTFSPDAKVVFGQSFDETSREMTTCVILTSPYCL
ncbi:MAG: hypothetical protein Q7J59_02700 [Elusimicrobiota bacterium]|nr:hypothetical protein [Elusimicrobiota bacterium]